MSSIDYYLSLQSPWTYLGHQRIVRYAAESGSRLTVYPLHYGEVFASTGGLPLPKRSPERQAYRLLELERWSESLAMPINTEPKHFPAVDTFACHCTLALRQLTQHKDLGKPSAVSDFAGRVLAAVWTEERNVGEEDVVMEILGQCECDAEDVARLARTDEIAQRFASDTREAIAKGVFGAPSYHVDGELFWGQDRLPFVARKLGIEA